ncbi:MAG: cobalamin-binding protein [candidate division WS1 bacterium]|jgi:5-methyltetrahydrofolate--homocysteine methyltransferase|nr:cobalamin-binding protein [candidate division WS1 bacterium]
MAELGDLSQAIINGDLNTAKSTTQELLDGGASAQTVVTQGLVPGMDVVGQKFKANEFYVPEVLIAARAMKGAMEILRPLLAESGVEPEARIAIGTVAGDLHDIGKNLVAMMLEGAGFEIIDLGVDVAADKFVEAVNEKQADIVALSALLTTTMPAMKDTIDALTEHGVRERVKVMIGGAPVTQAYADEIGADGYSPDGASAVDLARALLGK